MPPFFLKGVVMGTKALSETDVCNLALDLLNQDPITGIETPETETESVCARWYDQTRLALLRAHPWNFATKRRTITVDGTAPVFGYTKRFELPNNFVRLVSIGDETETEEIITDYQVEDGYVLASPSGDEIDIRYVYDITNVAQFDAQFTILLAAKMAMNISYKFTVQNSVYERIKDIVSTNTPESYSVDGQERPPKRVESSKLIKARRGGFSKTDSRYIRFE